MIIFVDAYNILKYFYPDEFITQKQRTQFVQQLVKYGKKKGHDLFVVFDGGPHGLPDRIAKKSVTVIYTGAQERADDYIIREMKKYKGFDVLIVSTDREITDKAEKHNIPYIDAHLFFKFVLAALGTTFELQRKEKKAQKLHPQVSPEIDALMESVEVPSYLAQEEEGIDEHREKGKKPSKNERRLVAIVDKL